jgi:DNA modification methylase
MIPLPQQDRGPPFTVGTTTIHVGDCRQILRSLPAQSVHCCVTSPPYFGLRDYGHEDEIGLEQSPDAFVEQLVDVFREVRRVLRNDGTLWLNLGDSYANDGKWGGHTGGKHAKALHCSPIGRNKKYTGLKPKDLIGVPWRVAFALQQDGWYLRQDIIWHKPNPMPESVRDRCTKAHEYIFLLSKQGAYYFDHEAMKEPAVKGAAGSRFHIGKTGEHQLGRASVKPRTAGNKNHKYVSAYEGSPTEEHRTKAGLMKIADVPWETRNRRSVWTVSTRPFKGAHFATFPPDLIEPCVLTGCPEAGTVLDPFFGAGTTGLVANTHGRRCIGIELNPTYADLAAARLCGDKSAPEAITAPTAAPEPPPNQTEMFA